jgi:Zn ribbon nucleic-acid-binding protein
MIKKIKNPKLKDSKFVIVPIPFEDELFSSWLIRTAYAHNTHPHTFIQLHLNRNYQYMSNNNLDVVVSDDELEKLEFKCNNKIELHSLTLKIYNGFLQENIINNGFNKLLCTLRFCPICIREDSIIYFRKHWKVVFNTICEKHKCVLYDSCPKCNNVIDISKMFSNKLTFKYCYSCGFDLTKSRKVPISRKSFEGINTVKKLNRVLKKGYIKLGTSFIYSFCFFDSLIQVSKKILKHKKTLFVNKRYLFRYLKFKEYSSSQPVYQQITINEQYSLFSLVFYLFKNYPQNLRKYIRRNNLSHWSTLRDMDYVSFWFESIVNTITPRYVPFSKLVTKNEIKNARNYLKSRRLLINKVNMTRLLGCNFFSVYNKLNIESTHVK